MTSVSKKTKAEIKKNMVLQKSKNTLKEMRPKIKRITVLEKYLYTYTLEK